MRVVPHPAAASAPVPYAAADTAFAEAKAYLSSREARQMSESDLERELHRRGQDPMRKLRQGPARSPRPTPSRGGGASGGGADGVERRERRVHRRAVETIFRTVDIDRVGYARPGHESLHPLDASLNLPLERYSLEMRRRVAAGAASLSFDEALSDLSDSTGAVVPKRQAEQLAVRAAEDFDAFYEASRRVLRGAARGGGRAGTGGVGGRAHLSTARGWCAPTLSWCRQFFTQYLPTTTPLPI